MPPFDCGQMEATFNTQNNVSNAAIWLQSNGATYILQKENNISFYFKIHSALG
jgi:hypothetical protein